MERNSRVDSFIKAPRKALLTLAAPIVFAQLIHSMYNIIDTAFVGRLGAGAIAAVTLSFPLFFFIFAFSFGLGVGSTSLIGKRIGQRRKSEAENSALHGILISILASFFFLAAGRIFMDDVFRFFGAEEAVIAMGTGYLSVIMWFVPLFFLNTAFFAVLSGEGDTRTPMMVQVFSLLLNIALDPVFIYLLGLGVRGAAIATVLSHSAALLVYLYLFFARRSTYLRLSYGKFEFRRSILYRIFRVGVPVILTHLIMSFGVILLNKVIAGFGTLHIASFGLAVRFDSLVMMPVFGISSALVALVSMFYGAKRPDLIRAVTLYGIKLCVAIGAGMGLVFFAFPGILLRVFTSDPALIQTGSLFLRFFAFTYPPMAVGMNSGRVIQGLGSGIPGLLITSARVLLVAIPLAYIFVYVLGHGISWVLSALVISSYASLLVSIPFLRHYLKKINAL